jgi:glycosyltransferase involved in cell wall biosynthesis
MILIYKGDYQYGAVNVFAESLGRGLETLGKKVSFVDFRERETVTERLRAALLAGPELIVSFGAIASDIKSGDAIVYDLLPCPFAAVLVDHPFYQLDRFGLKNLIITCFDRTHLRFLKNMPGASFRTGFLPHGGCAPESAPSSERPVDILFAGTFSDPEKIRAEIQRLPSQIRNIVSGAADALMSSHGGAVEEVFDAAAGAAALSEESMSLISRFYPAYLSLVDSYHRAAKRLGTLEFLDKQGVAVDIIGNHWGGVSFKNHRIHPPLPFTETLNLMSQSKIVLNVSLYPDGSHERIFSSMLSGAVCASDENPWLREIFQDGSGIIFHKWTEPAALADKLMGALSNPSKLAETAAAGREKSLRSHTWLSRAETLLKITGLK